MHVAMMHRSCFAILYCISILPLAYAPTEVRHGTMLFLRAGSSVDIGDLFMMPSYNDYDTTFKHLWNISDLMNGTTDYFRSPLMDRKSELEMTNFDVIAYNAAGEVMTSFPLEISGDDMVSSEGIFLFLPRGFMLKSAMSENKINVLAITINSTEPRGTQFILTSDDNFHDLPKPASMGCYEFPSTFLFNDDNFIWSVHSASECLVSCTDHNGYHYAAIFHYGNSSTPTHFYCLCAISISMAKLIGDNATQCPDSSDCGCASTISGVSHIYPSVYSMDAMNTFLAGLLNDTYGSGYFHLPIDAPYMSFAERTIIKGISIENAPTFEYELGISEGDTCEPNEDFKYYGTGLGVIEIFNASITQTIVGTPATCLTLKFKQTPPTRHVGVNIITQTDTFIKADYLRIVGHWKTSECVSRKRFHNSSLIPDVWVNIVQTDSAIAIADNENTVYFPESSAAVIHIRLPAQSSDFYMLNSIEFTANVELQINTQIETNGTCIQVGYGNKLQQIYKEDFTKTINSTHGYTHPVPQICARNISFSVNTTHPTGALSPLVNKMTFILRGCVLHDFDLSGACDNVDITSDILRESSASWTWVPHAVRAVTYLRPRGPGLVLYKFANPYIVVRLDDKWVDIEVTRVLITGDIMIANVTIGGVTQTLYNDSNTRLEYNPGGLRGHEIRIDIITGTFNSPDDYLIMHLYIEVCVPDFTANILTTSTETPITSSSGSATSPQSITSNSAVSTNSIVSSSQGSNTSPLVSTSTQSATSTAQITLTHASVATSLANSPQSTTHNSAVSTNTAAASSQGSNSSPLVSTSPQSATSTAQTTLTHFPTATPLSTSPPTVTSSSPVSTNTATVSSQGSNTSPLVSTLTSSTDSTAQTTLTHASTATPLATSPQPITSTASPASSTNTPSTVSQGTSSPNPMTSTSSPQASTLKSTTTGSVSTTSLSASTTATSPSHTGNHSTGTTLPPPNACCVCFSNTVNMSTAEVEVIVAEIVQNLTVPKQTTSAFKRRLISAPDQRTSAKMVGTVGIAMMTITGAAIVAMDYSSIVALLKFIKHLFV